jgi:pimeloyl-ACP methyl ester carboxylesterase
VRPSDIEAIADLLGETADATGGVAQETHEAIAQRVFRATGQFGRPTQAVHDRIARSVYSGVRLGLRTGARQAGRAVARSVPADAPALGTRTGEAVALGAIQGFAGDLLERRGSPLATELGIYVDGQRIEPTAEALAAAYPEPTRRLAVFVHGLCETEHAWKGLPRPGDQPRHTPFPERMRDDLDATPLLIRFNSGRHISENARDLDALLDDVIEHWPLPVLDLVLVGHSMGGLIVRSAAWQARERPWARLVRHVICLGTPHHGAELEQGAHLLDWALGQTPETRAFSRALRMRSSGIKDLRYGSALEEDWLDQDPDELLRRRAGEVPFLPHAEYCWVSASLTRGAVGRTLGDLLVRTPSASGTGRGQHVPFDLDNGSILHGLTHFDLLDHPAVYEQLLAWFTRPARLPART